MILIWQHTSCRYSRAGWNMILKPYFETYMLYLELRYAGHTEQWNPTTLNYKLELLILTLNFFAFFTLAFFSLSFFTFFS